MNETVALPKIGKLQLSALLLFWLVIGIFGGPVAYVVVPVCVFILGNKRLHLALFIGFLFVLILADSRLENLLFIENLRAIYLLLLAGFIFFDPYLQPLDIIYKAFIPFLLIALIFLINSQEVMLSFSKIVSYFLILAVVPTYMNRIYKAYSDEALEYIIYLGITLLGLGLVFWILRSDIVFLGGRYRGLFGNPNGLGIFAMLFFFLIFVINHYRPNLFGYQTKILFYSVTIGSILLCQSRTALAGVLIFIFFWQFYKFSKIIGFFILIAVIIFYHVIIIHIPDIVRALDLQSYARIDTLRDASGRFIAYQFAWEHIKQNIWIGGGIGFTNELFGLYSDMLSKLGHQGAAHNSYLTIWLDTGIFGLICFTGAWVANFLRASLQSSLAYPILLAILFSSFFESWLASSINAFTIIVLMILSLLTNPDFTGDVAE